jgi:hypothetical protein
MTARPGAALLELLTALTLLAMLTAACAVLVHSQSMMLRSISENSAADETLRTTRMIVRAEFQDLSPSDVRSIAGDSVAARVFRAWAIVCDVDSTLATLRYRGIREPEADKDSLLVLGEERAVAFSDAALPREPCPALASEERIAVRTARPLRPNAVVLLFESGSYHLATRALRYRRGLEGRQPVTDELIDDRSSGFGAEARGIVIRLKSKPRLVAARATETHVGFRNRAP